MAKNSDSGRSPGMIDSARRLGASMLGLVQTRLALASLDLADERDRLLRLAMLAIAAAVAFGLALAAFSGLLLVAFWDEWRVQVLFGLLVAYLLIGAWCVVRVRDITRSSSALFETTLGELERDRQALRDAD